MTNKIYVTVSFQRIMTRNLQTYVKSEVIISGLKKDNQNKKCEIKIRDTKTISETQFTYLSFLYDNSKEMNNYEEIKFEHVQARLYKGTNNYGKYYYIKIFMDEKVIFTHFFNKDELLIINKFLDLGADFSEDRKELVEFEKVKAI